MWKEFLNSYLNFSRKERAGIITILFLILFFSILPYFLDFFTEKKTYNNSIFKEEISALQLKKVDSTSFFGKKNYEEGNNQNSYETRQKNYAEREPWKGVLFEFDPNTLDEASWKKLGVREKTIATIQNYLSKGGKFYKPEDIDKIWGLTNDEVERLLPFVKIDDSKFRRQYEQRTYTNNVADKPKYVPKLVDINLADTTAFIALPGIGSKLSQRIISFREKLGGFYKVEQVGETFGLPDSVFQKIRPRLSISSAAVKKININTATVEELKIHPYIRYQMANAIVAYRKQHGNFVLPTDIKKILLVSDDAFNKVSPYLTTQ